MKPSKFLKTPAQVRFLLSKSSPLTDRQKGVLRSIKAPTTVKLPEKNHGGQD